MLGKMLFAYNLSTQEQKQQNHHEFKANLGYIERPCLRHPTKKKMGWESSLVDSVSLARISPELSLAFHINWPWLHHV